MKAQLQSFIAKYNLQGNQKKNLESTVTQVEKEKMLLQHRINEYQRKAEQENEKRRNAENEGKLYFYFVYHSKKISYSDRDFGGVLANYPVQGRLSPS